MAQPTWTANWSASASDAGARHEAAAKRYWTLAWGWDCGCDWGGLHCAWELAMSSSRLVGRLLRQQTTTVVGRVGSRARGRGTGLRQLRTTQSQAQALIGRRGGRWDG